MDYTLPEVVKKTSEQVELFKGSPMDTSVMGVSYREYRPTSQISHRMPISFTVTTGDYLDLKKTRLNLRLKIVKATGEAIKMSDKVGLINMPLHSIFRTVEVKLQQASTTMDVGTNYPYRAMIDTLLEDVEGSLEAQMFYKDTYAFMDSTQVHTGQNGGLTSRWFKTKDGNVIELEGPLHADLFKQDKLLLNGVRLDVYLHPNSDDFCLMVDTDVEHKVEIVEATLKMAHVKMDPGILTGHAETLKSKNALYPYTHCMVKVFNIPAGSYIWAMDNVFQDKIPFKVVLGLVSEEAYSGSTKKNPFNFQHCDVNYMAFLVDGHSRPGEPYQPDDENGAYAGAYTAMSKKYRDDGTYVKSLKYPKDYCLYVFDVEKNDATIKRGSTRIVLKMSKALKESFSLVAYGHFPTMIQIDAARTVNFDL